MNKPSFFTRHFGCINEHGYSVDLTRPEVFKAFNERYPEAATIVRDIWKDMGKGDILNPEKSKSNEIESNQNKDNEVELNEALLTENDKEKSMSFE